MPLYAAPAKINLSLRVLGRREDGFHALETVLAPISLADQISIEQSGPPGSLEFTCSDSTLAVDEGNLVVKAVRLLQNARPLPGLRIHLEKRVPHGAGLGGGSSDAATVLREVNKLTDSPLDFAELVKLAGELGSDVPFFLYGTPCLGQGRGEVLTPLKDFKLASRDILLIKLPFGVPTPWAYQRWRDSQELDGVDYAPQTLDGHTLVNDLERPVFEKHLVLAHLKTWLRQQPTVAAALMSGSGSTVIAFLRPAAEVAALEGCVKEWVGDEVWLQRATILTSA
jgi:4-diphosphocytidyl-2-C-methyl-D-erythritol kinase